MLATPAPSTAGTIAWASAAVASERLFAGDHLPGASRGNGNLRVRVVRAGDVDEIDVFPLDDRSANRSRRIGSPKYPRTPDAVGIAGDDRLQDRLIRQIEESRRLEERIAVRVPHEPVADQRDIERFLRHRQFHPCASRTAIIVESTAVHVAGCIIVAFGKHAAVPADVLERARRRSLVVAHPEASMAGNIQLPVRIVGRQ